MNMNFKHYEFSRDFIKDRKHIFYLMGYDQQDNVLCVVCSYSTKTKRLLIKCADENIPDERTLKEFVRICEL